MKAHNLIPIDIRPTEMSTIKYRMEFAMDADGFWNFIPTCPLHDHLPRP